MDIYGTTADVYRDSFGNPVNSANMNPGWGIDSALMTPSYDAPYRPQYSGPSGYSPYGRPGFGQAAGNLIGMRDDPYFGNPVNSIQPSVQSFSTKPFDAMAWGAQNIALPYVGYSGMAKILGPSTSGLWGMTKAMWRGEGVAAGLGHGAVKGMAQTLGVRGAVGSAMASGMAGIAGVASGVALPFVLGEAATRGLNTTFIDPYVNSRQNSDALQRNFSNVYLGGVDGNVVSGKGLSYKESARMGTDIMHQGLNDALFSREDYSNIADMGMRAGLFDNVKGSQITQRVKDIASQVKLVMAISNDPDFKNAVEELSKLNLAGADVKGGSTSVASNAYRQIGAMAAVGGTSVQKMMNTVGAQGQYLFQSNGMTPYLGQLAAANSYAGFSAAQRVGLLSPAVLSRMGGLDGATQASLTAQVIGAQTPLAMMSAYNRFIGGAGGNAVTGKNQSVTSTVAAFGASASRDPLEALGNMALYGRAAAGADLAQQGPQALENQMAAALKGLGQRGTSKDGRYSASQLAAMLKHYVGMTDDQATAFIMQRAGDQDKDTLDLKLSGLQGNEREQLRQTVNQGHLGGGIIDSTIRGVSRAGRSAGSYISKSLIDPVVETVGNFGDWTASATDKWNYGKSIADVDKIFDSEKTAGQKTKLMDIDSAILPKEGRGFWENVSNSPVGRLITEDTGRFFDATKLTTEESYGILRKINELAASGDKTAQSYINEKDPAKRRKSLDSLLKDSSSKLGEDASKLKLRGMEGLKASDVERNHAKFDLAYSGTGRVDSEMKVDNGLEIMNSSLARDLGLAKSGTDDSASRLLTVGAAGDLYSQYRKGDISKDELLEKIRSDKDGRFGDLNTLIGKDSTADHAITTLEDITRKSMEEFTESGRASHSQYKSSYNLAKQLYNSGATKKSIEGMSVEDRKKLIRDSGNAAGGIFNTGLSKKTAEAADSEELGKFQDTFDSTSNSTAQFLAAYRKGQFNLEDVTKNFKNIDKQSTFSLAVDKFATTVDGMKSGDKDKKTQVVVAKQGDAMPEGNVNKQVPGFKQSIPNYLAKYFE